MAAHTNSSSSSGNGSDAPYSGAAGPREPDGRLDYRAHEHAHSERLLALLHAKLHHHIIEGGIDLGDAVVRIERREMMAFFQLLKLDSELHFNLLLSVTAVDWLDSREERFEVVYHLASLTKRFRLRVKVAVPEEEPEVDSIVSLWGGANFMEREVWDMYGIRFKGHPDLRRILMYEEFKGHPLRKDYPLQGKQPRVALRAPEVRNTALDMVRPELVRIGARNNDSPS